ncbi:MAG: nickel pincer cofactor biosynthesis protein LarC [Eubacterium sp.]|nr:nickel pincer cofactor biosynthesis protein LarC [Eubacterium sp.]
MKVLYVDCGMGAAGDMLTAGLYELLSDSEKKLFTERLDKVFGDDRSLGFRFERSVKCGVTGTHFSVTVNGISENSVDYHGPDGHAPYGHGPNGYDDYGHGPDGYGHGPMGGPGYGQPHESYRDRYKKSMGDVQAEDAADGQRYGREAAESQRYRAAETTGYGPNHGHGPGGYGEHGYGDHGHGPGGYGEHGYGDHGHGPDGYGDHGHGPGGYGDHGHVHTSYEDIKEMAKKFNVPLKVKQDFLEVYRIIAEAESHAHGKPVTEIHFHEVGMKDAIVDIMSVCLLISMIKPGRIVASRVNTGFGKVNCMHGIIPVPAPATEFILKGIPSYSGNIEGELCTPTGAALLKHFVNEYGDMPKMSVQKVGYGMGTKDFSTANCVKISMGDTDGNGSIGILDTVTNIYNKIEAEVNEGYQGEVNYSMSTIGVLECNIDDMTGEELGYAEEKLLQNGALEVFTTAVMMKKGRPGVLLTVICNPDDRERMAGEIFRYTSTIGIRQHLEERYVLDRTETRFGSNYGDISVKNVSGYGVSRSKYEYEDLRKVAERERISIAEARKLLDKIHRN